MKQYTINIGLNVNGVYNKENLANTLQYFKPYGTGANYLYHRVETGQYDGESEPTAVICINCEPENIDGVILAACIDLKQECIPYFHESDKVGKLIYNPMYKGEKYDFAPEYFINLCKTSDRLF